MGDPFFIKAIPIKNSEGNGAEIVVVAILVFTLEKLVHKEALELQSAERTQIHVVSPLSSTCLCGLIIHFRPRKSSGVFSQIIIIFTDFQSHFYILCTSFTVIIRSCSFLKRTVLHLVFSCLKGGCESVMSTSTQLYSFPFFLFFPRRRLVCHPLDSAAMTPLTFAAPSPASSYPPPSPRRGRRPRRPVFLDNFDIPARRSVPEQVPVTP